MANAQLQQARRRTSYCDLDVSQPITSSVTQTMIPEIASSSVLLSQNEQLSDAQSEREALESALLARKITLKAELQALTFGKVMHKEIMPNCDATDDM
ncbi:unnamed protein product [Peronospora destructor]|uniref:Uncharacterized protein n=1 Tax=Peronospora destructor TaxID=86335 RepID=A0AAV0URE4_9STRA|nr:unnamed protein product [Peronospora destructor]